MLIHGHTYTGIKLTEGRERMCVKIAYLLYFRFFPFFSLILKEG